MSHSKDWKDRQSFVLPLLKLLPENCSCISQFLPAVIEKCLIKVTAAFLPSALYLGGGGDIHCAVLLPQKKKFPLSLHMSKLDFLSTTVHRNVIFLFAIPISQLSRICRDREL